MIMVPTWTEQRLQELRRYLAGRVNGSPSFSEIGKLMGVGKGAIAGIVRRSREKGDPLDMVIQIPEEPEVPIQQAAKSKPLPPPPPGGPVSLKAVLEPLERGECAYIKGDPAANNWRYCGHPAKYPLSYCEHHAKVCYNFQPPDRRRLSTTVTPVKVTSDTE